MKLKHILIAVGALVVLLVIGAMTGIIGGDKAEKVTLEKAVTRNVVETVTASGKIKPGIEVKVSSEVSGRS